MSRRTLLLTAAILSAIALRGSAANVVEIRVNGRFFSEPATVRVTIAVEPDAANRTLRIEADGDRLYRATEVTLDGASEKRLHNVEFKNLPAGEYELRAEVLSASAIRGMASEELMVLGVGRE